MDNRFTADHEWLAIDGNIAKVGITDHAQLLLGDLVFVGLPNPGSAVPKGATVSSVESVKAASDVYAPLSGTIVEVNSAVADNPSLVNSDPMGAGWLFTIQYHDASEVDALLSEEDYQRILK
jgi:glycine cleavage system H protein